MFLLITLGLDWKVVSYVCHSSVWLWVSHSENTKNQSLLLFMLNSSVNVFFLVTFYCYDNHHYEEHVVFVICDRALNS